MPNNGNKGVGIELSSGSIADGLAHQSSHSSNVVLFKLSTEKGQMLASGVHFCLCLVSS